MIKIMRVIMLILLITLVISYSLTKEGKTEIEEEKAMNTELTFPPSLNIEDEEFLELVERSTFLFFWEKTDEKGFTIESTAWPIGSIASSGFYLISIPIAIERGWIDYEKGRDQVLTTLNSYYDDPDYPNDFYVESEHGFFPHWFNQETGKWNGIDVFSSIDTAILIAGILTVRQYFMDLKGKQEQEIVKITTAMYEAVDWDWMTNGECTLSMGWKPGGFIAPRWQGYNEGMLAVLLALGSPTHPILKERCKGDKDAWKEWTATYKWEEWTPASGQIKEEFGNGNYRFVKSTSPALFTYQYPHIWFDLRGKKDKVGINYYKNSKIATLHNRDYCVNNPESRKGYGPNMWGLTASECPLHQNNYGVHGPYEDMDDGTIAPTGAGGSIIFTPQESIEALRYMKEVYGDKLWGKYGFKDAFNLDIDWFSPTYIGIDQGAILTTIENYRNSLIHSLFMQSEYVKEAMQKAGFTDIDTTPPAITHVRLENDKITARVTDNVGVESVTLYWNGSKKEMQGKNLEYSVEIPTNLSQYYIKAKDKRGNIATSRVHTVSQSLWLTDRKEETKLPPDAPPGSLLVDRFDGCISENEAGA